MSTSVPILLLFKVSLILAAAFGAAWLTRRAPARSRHLLWSAAFAAVLLLPIVAMVAPPLRVPLPSAWQQAPAEIPASAARDAARPSADLVDVSGVALNLKLEEAPIASTTVPARRRTVSARAIAALVWLGGVCVALSMLLVALVRVRRLSRTAAAFDDSAWHEANARMGAQLGLRRKVRLLLSADVTTPMAGGILRPTIFLPASAAEWPAERRDVVLTHEIAHLAGRDPLRQLLTRLALAAYWFHPLAWLAARESEIAREQACDETVLALGTRPSTYARVLLDFAGQLAPSAARVAALPIVEHTLLEKRLMAILNADAHPARRRLAFVPAALAALTLSVAAAQPGTLEPSQPVIEQDASGVAIGGVKGGVTAGMQGGVAAGAPQAVARVRGITGVPGGVIGGVPAGVAGGKVEGVVGSQAGSVCYSESLGNFRGNSSTTSEGGRMIVREAIGQRNHDLIIQKQFGDLRVCALAEGLRQVSQAGVRDWPASATRLVLETQEPGETRRMEIEGSRTTWVVNGQTRPVDADATEWRSRLLDLIEPVWELARLRGEVSSLRGEISSILGERSSLQGEISSLRGEVSSMQGEISSLRGQESSLRGEISSIRGELSSLQGQISSERGAISSLESRRWNATAAEEARIVERIRQHEARIREIEKEVAAFDADGKVEEVERRIVRAEIEKRVAEVQKKIRGFDVERRVDEVTDRITKLDVERRIGEIERKLTALKADERARALEERIETALRRLRDR